MPLKWRIGGARVGEVNFPTRFWWNNGLQEEAFALLWEKF